MKALHFLLIPALAAMAVSCSNEAEVLQPEQKADGAIIVRGTTEYTPATRTIFSDAVLGDKGATVSLTWGDPEDEYIEVVGFTKNEVEGIPNYVPRTLFVDHPGVSRSADGKSMDFSVKYPPDGDTEYTFAYLYPAKTYKEDWGSVIKNKNSLTALQTQTGNETPAHLSDYHLMYSDRLMAKGVPFTLHQQGAILYFVLSFPTAVTDGTITLSSDKESFISSVAITYPDGIASVAATDSVVSQSLKIESISPAANVVVAYMMVGAASGFEGLQGATLTLKAEMTHADKTSKTYTRVLGKTHNKANWEPGKCYHFAVKADEFKTNPTWAGSNIYWDGEQLTFAPAGTTDKQYYQGVFFKWGSLVGISSKQYGGSDAWSSAMTNSVPLYLVGSMSWMRIPISSYSNNTMIPYEDGKSLPTGTHQNNLYYADAKKQNEQWEDNKGDICQFLGAIGAAPQGYRMPRAEEFGAAADWARRPDDGGWTPENSLGNDFGTSSLTDKGYATWTATGAIFPAAGYRNNSDGVLTGVGSEVRYWSSSAADASSSGYYLNISSSGVEVSNSGARQFAYPIRCVKN